MEIEGVRVGGFGGNGRFGGNGGRGVGYYGSGGRGGDGYGGEEAIEEISEFDGDYDGVVRENVDMEGLLEDVEVVRAGGYGGRWENLEDEE